MRKREGDWYFFVDLLKTICSVYILTWINKVRKKEKETSYELWLSSLKKNVFSVEDKTIRTHALLGSFPIYTKYQFYGSKRGEKMYETIHTVQIIKIQGQFPIHNYHKRSYLRDIKVFRKLRTMMIKWSGDTQNKIGSFRYVCSYIT